MRKLIVSLSVLTTAIAFPVHAETQVWMDIQELSRLDSEPKPENASYFYDGYNFLPRRTESAQRPIDSKLTDLYPAADRRDLLKTYRIPDPDRRATRPKNGMTNETMYMDSRQTLVAAAAGEAYQELLRKPSVRDRIEEVAPGFFNLKFAYLHLNKIDASQENAFLKSGLETKTYKLDMRSTETRGIINLNIPASSPLWASPDMMRDLFDQAFEDMLDKQVTRLRAEKAKRDGALQAEREKAAAKKKNDDEAQKALDDAINNLRSLKTSSIDEGATFDQRGRKALELDTGSAPAPAAGIDAEKASLI